MLVGMKGPDLEHSLNSDTLFTLIAGIISSEGGVAESYSVYTSFSISFLQRLSGLVKTGSKLQQLREIENYHHHKN